MFFFWKPTQWKNDTWATGVCARKITTSKREKFYERPKRGSRWFKIWRKQTQGYNKWSWFLWNLPVYICFYQLTLIHARPCPITSMEGIAVMGWVLVKSWIMSIFNARWVCPKFCWQNLSPNFPIGFLLLYVLYFLLVQARIVCQATFKLKVWEEGGHHGLWENARVGVLKKSLSTQTQTSSQTQHQWVVGGFKHGFYVPFHLWNVILPIDELIFFKMVIAPPTI